MSLQDLIQFLQRAVSKGGLTSKVAADAAARLKQLDFPYDHNKFPQLRNTTNFSAVAGNSPSSLAEALLWKIGKWNDYRKFVSQYANDASSPGKSDVVFFAFAKHLKDPTRPIFDQHALRGLWAICNAMTLEERALCERFLMSGGRRRKGQETEPSSVAAKKWKQTGNGKTAGECYALFLKYLPSLKQGATTNREIDLVLMPLGQAIKTEAKTYPAFAAICGWKP
jgi:hypothetical protein